MELIAYLIKSEIKDECLTLKLYDGEIDNYYEDENDYCAVMTIKVAEDAVDDLTNWFENFNYKDNYVSVKNVGLNLKIAHIFSENQLQFFITDEPSLAYELDYDTLNWKFNNIYNNFKLQINGYSCISGKLDKLTNFLENEYSNTQKKLEYYSEHSNTDKVNELNGKIKFIESLLNYL